MKISSSLLLLLVALFACLSVTCAEDDAKLLAQKDGQIATLQGKLKEKVEVIYSLEAKIEALQGALSQQRKEVEKLRADLESSGEGIHILAFKRSKHYVQKGSAVVSDLYENSVKPQATEVSGKVTRKFNYFYEKQLKPTAGPFYEQAVTFLQPFNSLVLDKYSQHVLPKVNVVEEYQKFTAIVEEKLEELKAQYVLKRAKAEKGLTQVLPDTTDSEASELVDALAYSFIFLFFWTFFSPLFRLLSFFIRLAFKLCFWGGLMYCLSGAGYVQYLKHA